MAFHERRVLAQGSNSISQFLNMVRAIFLPHLSDETLSRSSLQLMFFLIIIIIIIIIFFLIIIIIIFFKLLLLFYLFCIQVHKVYFWL